MKLTSFTLRACGILLSISCSTPALVYADEAETPAEAAPNLPISASWGEPEFTQYVSTNKTLEWRYNRKDASLIITKVECKSCQPITQKEIDEYNRQKDLGSAALLLNHKGTPAMLRLYAGPNGINFHVFQIYRNGFHHEIQLGIHDTASQAFSFERENEFVALINAFK